MITNLVDKWEIVYWGGGAFRGRAELVKLVFAAADVKYTMQGDGIPEIIAAYPKEPTPVATILAKTPKPGWDVRPFGECLVSVSARI